MKQYRTYDKFDDDDKKELETLRNTVGSYVAAQFSTLHKMYASGYAMKQTEDDFILRYVSSRGEYIEPQYLKDWDPKSPLIVGKPYCYKVYSRFCKLLGEVKTFTEARNLVELYGLNAHINGFRSCDMKPYFRRQKGSDAWL